MSEDVFEEHIRESYVTFAQNTGSWIEKNHEKKRKRAIEQFDTQVHKSTQIMLID